MICLTCDIHHSSLRTGNQKACDISEIQCTQRFTKLLEEANVKATYFVTGRSFVEEWHDLKVICESPQVSIQGHNYYCFQPEILHRVWKKLAKNYNGPAIWEKHDIQRTIKVIEEKTGERISCWRNHMYMRGPNTDRLLRECGIEICSDGVKKAAVAPEEHSSGIWHFPINVIPDHEHLYHAERTPEWVAWWVQRYNWSDDFGSQSYYIQDWTEIVLSCLRDNEAKGAISNLIIHPITMYLCDQFQCFERILEFISTRKTVHMDELPLESGVCV